MITIQTRQNSKGNWWCNTTLNCSDISVEGKTVAEAQGLMSKELESRGHINECDWETPKFYPKKEKKQKSKIGYANWRIDKGMV